MKYNEKELIEISRGIGELEGRLNHKRAHKSVSEGPFAFSIVFRDELDKRHILTGRSEDQVNQWVFALKQASYEYWRSQLIMLQEKLCQKTGKDPLLIFPRNRGVIRDEAWNSTTTFRSHIRSLTGSTSSITSAINKETNLIELL
ncbi:hypothetical protein G9C98_007107 [Cotesia typhae]|uniref:PH domain-containing protein n=1 Tax=Cotesia typhae TaxID=2053667 RepID=A0A8J5QXE8_9HYME|nr:hypothetical protein G9C98_007107 [Cotesia typhae]